jgi:hypothetical protein
MRWTKFSLRIARRVSLARSPFHSFFLILLMLPGAVLSQEPTIRTQTNVVIIPALVKDAKGQIVYGLSAGDFIVEDDGVELPAHLEEADEGQQISLVLAIQTGRRANYEFARMRGLSSMLDLLLESGLARVAVVEFDSKPQLVQDFSSNSQDTGQTLKRVQSGDDGAAILDAIDYSIKLLNNAPKQRQRVLLLVSETRDHGSRAVKVDDAVAEIGQSDNSRLCARILTLALEHPGHNAGEQHRRDASRA